jgi:hypothetical protein
MSVHEDCEFEPVGAALAAERALRDEVSGPVRAEEELDPRYARIARAAASAEEELRVKLRAAAGVPVIPLRARRGRWLLALAAAAVVAAALVVLRGNGAPALLDGAPGDEHLGGPARILMVPEISDRTPGFSWHAVAGARSYDVLVVDARATVVLQRSAERAAATTWNLTPAEFAELKAHAGPLSLRVLARDGAGLIVGTTGDLQVHVR